MSWNFCHTTKVFAIFCFGTRKRIYLRYQQAWFAFAAARWPEKGYIFFFILKRVNCVLEHLFQCFCLKMVKVEIFSVQKKKKNVEGKGGLDTQVIICRLSLSSTRTLWQSCSTSPFWCPTVQVLQSIEKYFLFRIEKKIPSYRLSCCYINE